MAINFTSNSCPLNSLYRPIVKCFMTAHQRQCMEYIHGDQALALCQVRSALWLHLRFGGNAWSTSWLRPWQCAKWGVLYVSTWDFGAMLGVHHDSGLGSVKSEECFMTPLGIWGQCLEYIVTQALAVCQMRSALWLHLGFGGNAWSTSWLRPWQCEKWGVLYDSTWDLGQCLEYIVTQASAVCQVRSALCLHLGLGGNAWSTSWLRPWQCEKWGVLYDSTWDLGAMLGVHRDSGLGSVPSEECFMTRPLQHFCVWYLWSYKYHMYTLIFSLWY